MAFSINDIRSNLALGGARPTLFSIMLVAPPGGIGGTESVGIPEAPYLAHAASIPESALGTILVPYFGRKIKLPGDRTYAPWTVSILNDEDFGIRNMIETWMAMINSPEGNLDEYSTSAPSNLKASATVTQYGKTGNVVRVYNFDGLWPSQVAPIEVNWSLTDQIESFNVTFEYDYWDISGGTTGNAGGT